MTHHTWHSFDADILPVRYITLAFSIRPGSKLFTAVLITFIHTSFDFVSAQCWEVAFIFCLIVKTAYASVTFFPPAVHYSFLKR